LFIIIVFLSLIGAGSRRR